MFTPLAFRRHHGRHIRSAVIRVGQRALGSGLGLDAIARIVGPRGHARGIRHRLALARGRVRERRRRRPERHVRRYRRQAVPHAVRPVSKGTNKRKMKDLRHT